MDVFDVAIFKRFPFKVGQKIRILDGKRQGDWEVINSSETKVTLRCPISGRQFEWDPFCYLVEERHNEIWPEK